MSIIFDDKKPANKKKMKGMLESHMQGPHAPVLGPSSFIDEKPKLRHRPIRPQPSMDPRTLVGISHNFLGDQSLMLPQKPKQNINPITRSLINIDGVRLPINPANQLSIRPPIQQLQPQRFVDVVQLLIQNKSG
jgi:hypothetical protein